MVEKLQTTNNLWAYNNQLISVHINIFFYSFDLVPTSTLVSCVRVNSESHYHHSNPKGAT